MYAKLKTNLIGLAAALSFVVVGFSLGEAPSASQADPALQPVLAQAESTRTIVLSQADRTITLVLAQAEAEAAAEPATGVQATAPATGRRGALQRHLAMPYVSFAALLPRQES